MGFEQSSPSNWPKELIKEKQLNEKAYIDMNATFELKGFGTNIFIKGKTTESVGLIGRQEGIAAMAITSVQLPEKTFDD